MGRNLRDLLLRCINKVLETTDITGTNIHDVCLIERCWNGDTIGDGNFREKISQILPTPGIREFSHNIMASEGGAIQQGDVLLTRISGCNYDRQFLSTQQDDPLIEKFYLVDNQEYRVVNIVERFVTWDVLIRQTISGSRSASPRRGRVT